MTTNAQRLAIEHSYYGHINKANGHTLYTLSDQGVENLYQAAFNAGKAGKQVATNTAVSVQVSDVEWVMNW